MGRYMPQQELERVVEYEQRTLAERLALTARDFSQDARDAGYAPTLNLALSAKGGFPEIEQQIFELLKDSDMLQKITAEWSEFVEAHEENRDLLRFSHARPKELLQALTDLEREPITFTAAETYEPQHRFFISMDEIDNVLRGGSEEYRLAVYSYFVNHSDLKDREKYLKNYHGEYSGYHGGNDNRTYTSKGLSFSHGDLTQPYNYIVKPLGDMYLSDVTADDIKLAMIPVSKMSQGYYSTVNMLMKCIFYSAERSNLLDYNPSAGISAKGGKPKKKKDALTDEQAKRLLDAIRGLPPYVFVMIGLYAGLRREEILALQWDCVFLDVPTPYISVQRAWRSNHGRPEISTVLKTNASKRDVPIPKRLIDCLQEAKAASKSKFVVADSNGEPLSYSQFQRVWQYIVVRTAKPRYRYKYVNGQSIKILVNPTLGEHQKNNPKIVYSLDFDVTPHQLRHTYITNLLYAGVDPKTVQYLAGHKNSKTTMDIYAKIKYNKPEQLCGVVNAAFHQSAVS